MNLDDIQNQIELYKNQNKKMFATTSLQTQSIPLLHILMAIDRSIPVYFINTGFHFPETMSFRDQVSKELGIDILILNSSISHHLQKESGNFLFTIDPDHCCYLNKIAPVEQLLMSMDIWINGVRSVQNENRKNLATEEKATHDTLRFHPLIDWTDKMIFDYIKKYNLPRHPLDAKGYTSIGCEPCTRSVLNGNHRDSRWFGLNKTECGLNTDLIDKK
jgi:phosphoadenosine phosphosulfate reductase